MYSLELVLVISLLILLFSQSLVGIDRKVSLTVFLVIVVTLLLSAVTGQARWQMAPAYFLFIILALLLLKRSHFHVILRSIGVLFGIVFLSLGVLLGMALPVVTLPAPDGPYTVGSRSFTLTDEYRDDPYFDAPSEPRRLYIQVWYPGELNQQQPTPRVRTLWQELYSGPQDLVAFLTRYLSKIKTHTYQDIPVATTNARFPVIVFSHSLGLSPEQNTPLMEHLASHGYAVIGIGHTYMSTRVILDDEQVVLVHPQRQQEAFSEGASIDEDEIASRLKAVTTIEDRAKILYEVGEQTVKMNEQIAIREDDIRFVMNTIAAPPPEQPTLTKLFVRFDPEKIGLLGMSVGGAAIIDV